MTAADVERVLGGVWIEPCGMTGCAYLAQGRTKKQVAARLMKHWTKKDHAEYVDAIARGDEKELDDG